MRLGVQDHKALAAFVDKKPFEGHKLSTDGRKLDGHWLGGSRIAYRSRGQIHLSDLGSRAAESVQRVLRRHAAPSQLAEWKGIKRDHARGRPGNPRGLEVGDAVQLRFEPGTGGVIQRFEPNVYGEQQGWAWVAVPSDGSRRVPTHALRLRRSASRLRDRPRRRASRGRSRR